MTVTFNPDWRSPPGDTIRERLDHLRITEAAFATQLAWPIEHVLGLLNGTSPITPKVAEVLVKVVGGTVSFWLKREADYRLPM